MTLQRSLHVMILSLWVLIAYLVTAKCFLLRKGAPFSVPHQHRSTALLHLPNSKTSTMPSIVNKYHLPRSTSRLYLDVFGLGPAEVLVILVAAGVLFGPDQLKNRLQKSKPKAIADREKLPPAVRNMYEMMDIAEEVRKTRALRFLDEGIEQNDSYVLQRLEAFEHRHNPPPSTVSVDDDDVDYDEDYIDDNGNDDNDDRDD